MISKRKYIKNQKVQIEQLRADLDAIHEKYAEKIAIIEDKYKTNVNHLRIIAVEAKSEKKLATSAAMAMQEAMNRNIERMKKYDEIKKLINAIKKV